MVNTSEKINFLRAKLLEQGNEITKLSKKIKEVEANYDELLQGESQVLTTLKNNLLVLQTDKDKLEKELKNSLLLVEKKEKQIDKLWWESKTGWVSLSILVIGRIFKLSFKKEQERSNCYEKKRGNKKRTRKQIRKFSWRTKYFIQYIRNFFG